jgi:predicted TIM-barrel fold metal-dependent hydrolase
MWSAAEELRMLRAAGLAEDEMELILHKNAERLFFT